MKNMTLFLMMVAVLSVLVVAEAYRRTTSDMYRDSYMATMRRQSGAGSAEMRADQYRSMYDVCDEHHNCSNVTAGALVQPVEEARRNQVEPVKPFAHASVWM